MTKNIVVVGAGGHGKSAWAQAGVALGYGVLMPEKQVLKPGESR